MEIQRIKDSYKLVESLSDYENRLNSLNRTEQVDFIQIRRHQSGAPNYSYEVRLDESEDREFLKIIKSMIKARIELKIQSLKKEIESI